ncbi:MAG: TorD/DmsD family molecular chaperone [Planctomycetota bacterium]|jgi:TorA maturation chaperone TorD
MTAHARGAEIEHANAYHLLSRAYGAPDEELFACLTAARGTITGPCSKAVEHAAWQRDLAQLQLDHARLFVGPFKVLAPPYGSLYLDRTGQVMGDSTVDVRTRYEEEGLEVTLSEVPDHVAIELEFAHFLAARAARAIQESDAERADRYVAKRRDFLSVHLGVWVGEFAANVERHARTDFYRVLVHATEALVLEDLARLRAGVPELGEAAEPLPAEAEARP